MHDAGPTFRPLTSRCGSNISSHEPATGCCIAIANDMLTIAAVAIAAERRRARDRYDVCIEPPY